MNIEDHIKNIEELLNTRCETASLDFKSEFNPNSNQDWCELVKDIVAMANSGGGIIAIGLNDDGSRSSSDIKAVFELDPADVCNKVEKYTGCCYSQFRIVGATVDDKRVVCFVMGAVYTPMLFAKPGTYQILGSGQQKTAFSQGTLYFRHGAKSEPGTTDDVRAVIEREVERLRSVWLENVRKVVEAPVGSKVFVVQADDGNIPAEPREVRLTTSPEAPLVRELDPNKTHPYRQKDVVKRVNEKLDGTSSITRHDVFALRKVHGIEEMPEFYYRPKFSSSQFSEAFVDWVVAQFRKSADFIEQARQDLRKMYGTQRRPLNDDDRLRWLDTYMQKNGLSISAIARKLEVSPATLSLVLRGVYNGDVGGIMKRIEAFKEVEGQRQTEP